MDDDNGGGDARRPTSTDDDADDDVDDNRRRKTTTDRRTVGQTDGRMGRPMGGLAGGRSSDNIYPPALSGRRKKTYIGSWQAVLCNEKVVPYTGRQPRIQVIGGHRCVFSSASQRARGDATSVVLIPSPTPCVFRVMSHQLCEHRAHRSRGMQEGFGLDVCGQLLSASRFGTRGVVRQIPGRFHRNLPLHPAAQRMTSATATTLPDIACFKNAPARSSGTCPELRLKND